MPIDEYTDQFDRTRYLDPSGGFESDARFDDKNDQTWEQAHSLEYPETKSGSAESDVFGDPARFLPSDIGFLTRYNIRFTTLSDIVREARENGVEGHKQLIASGVLTREDYYRYLADHLSLRYLKPEDLRSLDIVPQEGIIKALRHKPRVLVRDQTGKNVLVCAPKREEIEQLRFHLQSERSIEDHFSIASPATISRFYLDQLDRSLEVNTTNILRKYMPHFSAFRVEASKIIAFVASLASLFAFFVVVPMSTLTFVVSILLAALFFASVMLRFAAALTMKRNKKAIPPLLFLPSNVLPIYSVLVAAYDEAEVIGDLVMALAQLDWPAAKLDIKIVLERDDHKTIEAAKQAIKPWSFFEIVLVPPGKPRTKPRALNYALPLASGKFVTVYDAEDRPDPLQLRAAHHRFLIGSEDLACIQAPLLIDNPKSSWLATMFAIEYAGLFDGLVPALSRWRFPVLLGGTSNHFKIERLRAIGGWDPHNVTEDADLGIRLQRFGYRVGSIDYPTDEEAPTKISVWMKQRTRWFKGWMQTTLVHVRNPKNAVGQLGLTGFFIFHLLATTLIVAALGYPFFVVMVAVHLFSAVGSGTIHLVTFLMSANLVFAFIAYALLSARALAYRDRGTMIWHVFALPFYWLLLFVAAWRALFQLLFDPHVWEKTPHGDEKRRPLQWRGKRLANIVRDGLIEKRGDGRA